LEALREKLSEESTPLPQAASAAEGPVNFFVSAEQGTSFAKLLRHSVLEEDGEVVEGLLPVMDRHRPLA
jgi:hypothetical protein